MDFFLCTGIRKETVADLHQNTDTIANLSAGITASSVIQFLYNLQGIIQHGMVLMTVNIDDCANTAGIMFPACFIQFVHMHLSFLDFL